VKVELEKAFPLPAAPAAAWALLQDIEAVAACMPGAKITQRADATHYKGTVTVRVGPATLSFRGDIEVREVDAATRTLRLFGSGSDTTGSSAGSMDLTARIDAADGGLATLNGQSVVSLSGKAAAFGGRMVNSVADQILGQFARNFAARVEAPAPPRGPPSATTGAAPPTPRATGESPPAGAATPSPSAASTAARTPVANEINALALLWAIFWDWLRGLFRRKRA
jgi:carbon monoxide dehydrogenase subunit G